MNKTFFGRVDKTWRKLKRHKITGVRGLCCGTCSACEGGNRMEADKSLVGYAYYHRQDWERVEHDGLYVGFGADDGSDENAVKVAGIIRDLFEKDGFKVDWDGSAGNRLLVKED